MHYSVLITGSNPEKQLEKFSEHLEFLPYHEGYATKKEVEDFVELYTKEKQNKKLSLEELYKKYGEEWNNNEWRYNKGTFEIWLTRNPNAKWDWYQLGGRYSGLIKLKKGAKGLVGLPGIYKNKIGIDKAVKRDIENLKDIQTYAFLHNGDFVEREYFSKEEEKGSRIKPTENFKEKLDKILEELPEDTLISIYDYHN